jgi:hypothetical protein
MIELGQVLEQMHKKDRRGNAIPFSVEFVTADMHRGTGGDIKQVKNAVMVTPNRFRNHSKKTISTAVNNKKGQNHYANMTRNIRQLNDTAIVKLHIWLITKFNDEQVVWNIMG